MGIQEKILKDVDVLHQSLILLADVDDEPINGRVKLQKIMYLLADKVEEIKAQSRYNADNYGPYSEVIDEEARYLERVGVLASNSGKIVLTVQGKEIARELVKQEDEETLRALSEYKRFLNDLPSNELLAYIYTAYPDMVDESVEYRRLKPNIEAHILSLVRKQKISSQRAAELLDRSQDYIIKKMRNSRIAVLG